MIIVALLSSLLHAIVASTLFILYRIISSYIGSRSIYFIVILIGYTLFILVLILLANFRSPPIISILPEFILIIEIIHSSFLLLVILVWYMIITCYYNIYLLHSIISTAISGAILLYYDLISITFGYLLICWFYSLLY